MISMSNRYTLQARLKVALFNFKQAVKGSNTRISFDTKNDAFLAVEGIQRRYFRMLTRGLKMYRKGLQHEGQQLFNAYCLNEIEFTADDIVIDCGANFGSLFLSLSKFIAEENYITFEPSFDEHYCLTKSVPNANHKHMALADCNQTRQFFVSSEKADSSLIEPLQYTHAVEIECISLDTFLQSSDIEKIKLLKLEAEGFEPEILLGARSSLTKIEYVAIDGGPERGLREEETFTTLSNALIGAGFEMTQVNFKGYRALFRNRRFSENIEAN